MTQVNPMRRLAGIGILLALLFLIFEIAIATRSGELALFMFIFVIVPVSCIWVIASVVIQIRRSSKQKSK